jgi:hypothetical protein
MLLDNQPKSYKKVTLADQHHVRGDCRAPGA